MPKANSYSGGKMPRKRETQVEREGREVDRMQRKAEAWNKTLRKGKKKKKASVFAGGARAMAIALGNAKAHRYGLGK